jgi:hypothetical protein
MKHVARSPRSTRVLEQFDNLLQELRNGTLNRNTFRLWEAEIILDILTSDTQGAAKRESLREYQKSVHRRLAHGSLLPMKFSEYLESTKHARPGRAA